MWGRVHRPPPRLPTHTANAGQVKQWAAVGDLYSAGRSTPARGLTSGGMNQDLSPMPYCAMVFTLMQFGQMSSMMILLIASSSAFSSLVTPKMTLYFVDMIGYFSTLGASSTCLSSHSGCWTIP